MKRILVPIHAAQGSLLAVDAALHLASTFDASVDLVHVEERRSDEAEVQLVEGKRRLDKAGVASRVVRLEGGGKIGLQLAAQADGADLVVIRSESHRAPGAETGQVRSTTLSVLKRSPCPLLAVTVRTTSMLNPLFAYNGSPQSRAAIGSALAILGPTLFQRGTVMVVTSDEHMAERLAAEIQTLGAAHGVPLDLHWSPGKPGRAITQRIKDGRHDVVVIGALGRSWLKEQLFGSTTNDMLRHCKVPIWLDK